MTATAHKFRWNLPFAYDADETEVEVHYSYTKGKNKRWKHSHDPDFDPDVIEEVEIRHATGQFKGLLVMLLPEWVYDEAEAACWDHAAEQEPEE